MIKRLTEEKNLVLFDQAVFSGTSFTVTALLARFLGIEGFGVYSSIILGIYLLISMSNALIIQPMQVAFAKFENSKSYIGFTFLLQLLICSIIFLLFVIVQATGIINFDQIASINFLYIGAIACLWLTHDYFRKMFLALQEIKNTIVVDCIMAGIQLTGIIGLGVTHQLNLDATIIIMASGYFVSSLVGFFLSSFSLKDMKIGQNYLAYHKKEGSLLFLSSLLQWWSGNLFVVASGLFLGVAALGAFRLVQSMFGVLNLLLQTYENYVLPKAAKLYAASQVESKLYLRSITSKGGILFAIVLIPLFAFSKYAIQLFGGAEYVDYHYIVRGMVILYCIIYAGYTVRMPIRILALNRSFFVGYCISFLFSVLSFNFLLNNFGIEGALAGLIINQLLMIGYWRNQLTKHKFSIW